MGGPGGGPTGCSGGREAVTRRDCGPNHGTARQGERRTGHGSCQREREREWRSLMRVNDNDKLDFRACRALLVEPETAGVEQEA